MLKTFESFFFAAIHPYQFFDSIRHNIPVESWFKGNVENLSLNESLLIAWCLKIIKAILEVSFILIMANSLFSSEITSLSAEVDTSLRFFEMEVPNSQFISYAFIIVYLIFDTMLFPLLKIISIEIWLFVLGLFADALKVEGDREQVCQDIVKVSLSSYIFQVIPIVGESLQWLSSHFYIFVGSRRALGASSFLSFCIMLTPTLIFLAMISLILTTMAAFFL